MKPYTREKFETDIEKMDALKKRTEELRERKFENHEERANAMKAVEDETYATMMRIARGFGGAFLDIAEAARMYRGR